MIPDDWWMNGYCSTFAARMQQRFGGELWAVVNVSRKYNDEQLWHCYCVIGNTAYDAIGPHTIEEASNTSEERYPIPEMDKDNDVAMMWKQVDTDWLARIHDNYDPDYFQAVDEYIDRHTDLFRRCLHESIRI